MKGSLRKKEIWCQHNLYHFSPALAAVCQISGQQTFSCKNADFQLLSFEGKLHLLLATAWFCFAGQAAGPGDSCPLASNIFMGTSVLLGGYLATTNLFCSVLAASSSHPLCWLRLVAPLHESGSSLDRRQLGRERGGYYWGKLQGSKIGIEAGLAFWKQVKR